METIKTLTEQLDKLLQENYINLEAVIEVENKINKLAQEQIDEFENYREITVTSMEGVEEIISYDLRDLEAYKAGDGEALDYLLPWELSVVLAMTGDPSERCGLIYNYIDLNDRSKTVYYDYYCSKCPYMHEICMYGK